ASSAATASRETRVTPSPTRADSRIAPLDPTMSASGAMSSSASSAAVLARVPEPGSRSSQVCRASQVSSPSAPPAPAGSARPPPPARAGRAGRAARAGGADGRVGGAHHDQVVRPDREHGHVPPRLGPPADHQVDLVPVEQGPHPVPVAGLQPDPGQRVLPPEAAEDGRHYLLRGRGHGRAPQLPTPP